MSDDPARIEDVRRRLRERGYLDGPVKRFVFGGPAPRVRRWRTVLRAALVGGPLLGVLLAGTAVFAAGLSLVDFAVLWAYFSIAAALALLLLDTAAGIVATAFARRGVAAGTASLRGALVVALPAFAYLLLLWWRRSPEAGPVDDVLFLAFTVTTVALLAWLAGLVSVAGIAADLGQVPRRRRRPPAIVIVPLALGISLFVVSRLVQERPPDVVPEFSVDTAAAPLVLVGVDGLDHELVSALEARGALPNLLRRMERATVFPMMRPADAAPPAVWTTLATGTPARIHGIAAPGVERLPGVAAPLERAGPLPLAGALKLLLPTRTAAASGLGRQVRTLWEIVALRSSSVSVGWWGSWPPERPPEGAGGMAFVVTDRALPKLLAGADPDRDTEPEALFGRLVEAFPVDLESIGDDFRASFDAGLSTTATRLASESHGIDAWNLRVAARLVEATEARAVFVYLPGLDILRHRLAVAGSGPGATRVALEAPGLIEAYAGWLDRQLGSAMDRFGSRQTWIVADPGRRAAAGAEGFVIHDDGQSDSPCLGASLAPAQVSPLVLGSLGFPASHEMAALPPTGRCIRAEPLPRIDGFGRRSRPQALPGEDEAAILERLRSLGYLN